MHCKRCLFLSLFLSALHNRAVSPVATGSVDRGESKTGEADSQLSRSPLRRCGRLDAVSQATCSADQPVELPTQPGAVGRSGQREGSTARHNHFIFLGNGNIIATPLFTIKKSQILLSLDL